MTGQKGQSAVEFIAVLPFFFILVFAMLYIGMMFMDYIQFSNAARAAARDIALLSSNERDTVITKLNAQDEKIVERYAARLTKLYNPTFEVELESKPVGDAENPEDAGLASTTSVSVTVNFERIDANFPSLLLKFEFPPKNLACVTYKMPLSQ